MSLLISCSGAAPEEDVPGGGAAQYNVTETGIVSQPRDPAVDGFRLIPPSAASAWWEVQVRGERIFLPDHEGAPDVSTYHFGRGDALYPDATSKVAFEISELSGWRQGDILQIVSPNVGLTMVGPENEFAVYPSVGSTTISGQALDWKGAIVPLVDAGRGDRTWVAQMTAGSPRYTKLARAAVAPGFTVGEGRMAKLSAALAPVPQDRTLALRWKGSAYAALAAQAGSGAQPAPAPALSIRALPDALARSNNFFSTLYTHLPSLVDFGPISGSDDLDETVTYGNPFSSGGARWTELATVVYAIPVSIRTPAGSGLVLAMQVSATPVAALARTGILAPPITPVRNVRVNGQPLDAPRTGAGAAATLTWEAPAVGTATEYAVAVHEIETSRLGVNVKKIATLHTKSRSLALPGELLGPGGSYAFTITAIAAPGADLTRRPFVGTLPYASSDYVTAQLTP